MKSWTYNRYGTPDVLRLVDAPIPAPGPGEVVVRVRAASINSKDWRLLVADPAILRMAPGALRGPRGGLTPAGDFAGLVEAVGEGVIEHAVGDEVYGYSMAGGALAERIAVAADRVAPKPAGITFDQAAATPLAALTALAAVRDVGRVGFGDRVLINGASGGVGTFAVQIAKARGASHVTAVCSGRNAPLIRAIGADRTVDYSREDVTSLGETFDVVIDCAGGYSLRRMLRILPRGGRVAMVGGGGGRWLGPLGQIVRWRIASPFVGRSLRVVTPDVSGGALRDVGALIDAGDVTPVIDETYPLSAVPDAMRYFGTGHVRAKVVITV